MLEEQRARYREVGDTVRRERRAQGYSQESLAHTAGVSSKTVQRIESANPREARGSTFQKLAKALDYPIKELLGPLQEGDLLPERGASARAAGAEDLADLDVDIQSTDPDSTGRDEPEEDSPG